MVHPSAVNTEPVAITETMDPLQSDGGDLYDQSNELVLSLDIRENQRKGAYNEQETDQGHERRANQ